jgi:hemerythrin
MDLTWKKKYETGINELDEQHKYFFLLLNELHKSLNIDENEEKILGIIAELEDYTEYHFKSEEAFLKTINYPLKEAEEHKKHHQTFIEKLQRLNSDTTLSLNIKAFQLAEFLIEWLTDHILLSDMKYADFYKMNN